MTYQGTRRSSVPPLKTRLGFTLVEILLVLTLIAGLATVVVVVLLPQRDQGRIETTQIKIQKIMGALQLYANTLPMPTESQGLSALIEKPSFENTSDEANWHGPYYGMTVSDLKDEWGNEIHFKTEEVSSGDTTRTVARIWSNGPNGNDESGDGDDIKDKNWASETASK